MRRVLLTTLIVLGIVVVAAGIGFAGFRLGVNYGLTQSPQIAQALQNLPEGAQPGYGWHMRPGAGMMPFGGHHGGWGMRGWGWGGFGFGFLQCLVPLFFLVLLFGFLRFVFRPWGWGRWGHYGGPGHWGKEGLPPHFEEWHKRAHGETPPPAAGATPPNP